MLSIQWAKNCEDGKMSSKLTERHETKKKKKPHAHVFPSSPVVVENFNLFFFFFLKIRMFIETLEIILFRAIRKPYKKPGIRRCIIDRQIRE